MAPKLILGAHAAAQGVDVSAPGTPAGLGLGLGLGLRQGVALQVKTGALGKGALRPRRKAGRGTPAAPHCARILATRASSGSATEAWGGSDAFLEEIEELPDGSLVLHYSSEGAAARRKEGRLVSFLTKPVPGQRRREVPKDVLQQILGGAPRDSGTTSNGASASTHNQSQGLASFVKGVLAPSDHNGSAASQSPPATSSAAPTHTSTGGQVPVAPAAAVAAAVAAPASTGAQQTVPAPPSLSAAGGTAAPSEAGGASEAAHESASPSADAGSGQSGVVRTVVVVLAAATFTAALRGLALALGPARNVPLTAPVSLYATAAAFLLTSLLLWVTGFASLGKGSPQGALA